MMMMTMIMMMVLVVLTMMVTMMREVGLAALLGSRKARAWRQQHHVASYDLHSASEASASAALGGKGRRDLRPP